MWFWYGLSAALVGAISIIISKQALKQVNASVATWALFTLQIPVTAYLAFRGGLPQVTATFFFGVTGSSIFFVLGKTLAMSSIKQEVLSKVFPLMSLNVAYLYLLGIIFLGETIRLFPSLGLLLIILGAYTLNAASAKESLLTPLRQLISQRASRLYLIATIATAISAIFDKIALTNISPPNPPLAILAENILMSAALFGYLSQKKKDWWEQIKNNFWILALASLVYMFMGILVFSGFYDGPVALVSGVKKLQILFTLALSWLFFHDKPSKFSLTGTFLMLAGVMMIKIF